MISIHFESPDQAEVLALIAELDAYQATLYPPESVYALDLTSVAAGQIRCAVARDAAGQVLACGALLLLPEYGELKRMMVRPAYRGQGLAKKILLMLEAAAAAAGCRSLKLETGPLQAEALGLYARCGYTPCARYGAYRDDPLSVFMQKQIAA